MEETKGQRKPERSGTGTELRVVRIDFDPGPDAEDRLRRLFTLLVKYAAKDRLPVPGNDPASEDRAGDEG